MLLSLRAGWLLATTAALTTLPALTATLSTGALPRRRRVDDLNRRAIAQAVLADDDDLFTSSHARNNFDGCRIRHARLHRALGRLTVVVDENDLLRPLLDDSLARNQERIRL